MEANDLIEHTLAGNGGATSTQGSDTFANEGVPQAEVQLPKTSFDISDISEFEKSDDDNYIPTPELLSVQSTPAKQRPSQPEPSSDESSDESFQPPVKLVLPIRNNRTKQSASSKEFNDSQEYIDFKDPSTKKIAEKYKSLYGDDYNKDVYKNGKYSQFRDHINKYPKLNSLRNRYVMNGGKKTDDVYVKGHTAALQSAFNKLLEKKPNA
jgi:hypothetical protein